MEHLNGKKLCVIDTETTGLDPKFHEIWQICILALTSNVEIDKTIMPFYITMKPDNLEYIDWSVPVMKKNKKKILKAAIDGHDKFTAADLLEEWIKKLKIPYTKYGNMKKIEPVGQNYAFDKSFIEQWLGVEQYNEYFDYHYRDTMHAALYLNDRAAFHAAKIPFNKVNLRFIALELGVSLPDEYSHDALADCQATANCYRKMCQLGVMA